MVWVGFHAGGGRAGLPAPDPGCLEGVVAPPVRFSDGPDSPRYARSVTQRRTTRASRSREVYVCRACGAAHARWLGRCPDCGAWDSLEGQREDSPAANPGVALVEAWEAVRTGDGPVPAGPSSEAVPIADVAGLARESPRLATGIGELDRVLGDGIVPGSAVLVAGSPGMGKSTLLLQAAGALAGRGTRVLYVSSEESAGQVALRATRLGIASGADPRPGLFVLADTNLARIVEQARKIVPGVLVIDSVQMLYESDVPGAPGSIAQLRRCGADLVAIAKRSGIAVVLVGHVTKEGQVAGPRLLEHLVDAVLWFEGDRYHALRIVRAAKNRFGATLEIGVFEMTGSGLRELPGGAGVAARLGTGEGRDRARPGSVVCPVLAGTRCVLVEIQALTATGFLGAAKRKSSGLDPNRLAMIIAVLEAHAGLRLADRDVFASAVGGVRVVEPAADLALLLAIAGAHSKRALAPGTIALGEVGLGGEVRPVTSQDQRLREAARLGYTRAVVPAAREPDARAPAGLEVVPVGTVSRAIEELG